MNTKCKFNYAVDRVEMALTEFDQYRQSLKKAKQSFSSGKQIQSNFQFKDARRHACSTLEFLRMAFEAIEGTKRKRKFWKLRNGINHYKVNKKIHLKYHYEVYQQTTAEPWEQNFDPIIRKDMGDLLRKIDKVLPTSDEFDIHRNNIDIFHKQLLELYPNEKWHLPDENPKKRGIIHKWW